MRFGDDWLKEWVQPVPAPQELAHLLTMGGLEVDGIQPAAPPFHGVVVARIVSVAAHPQADRLRICQIDDGGAEALQVVCGAANAAEGLRIPLARVGAALPSGLQIKAARLRGSNLSACCAPPRNWAWPRRPKDCWNCPQMPRWAWICGPIWRWMRTFWRLI